MSTLISELGNVQYIYLRDLDCNGGASGAGTGTFVWTLPTLPARESSFMYIQVVQGMIQYSGTGQTGQAEPQYLVYNNLFSDSMFSSNNQTTLASILQRDSTTGTWIPQSDSPVIRVPSNLSKISFTVYNQGVDEINNTGPAGSISILLKIIKPQRDVVQDNTLNTYVRTIDPRLTPHFAFTN